MTDGYVTHLEAAIDGTRYTARTLQTVHEGRPLWVRYDLGRLRIDVSRDDFRASLRERPHSMWRYDELSPIESEDDVVSLGEVMTPVMLCPTLGADLGVENLYVKDESHLPTGSFKARGMAMAVSMAKSLGVKRLAVPTAGNAGGALAAYAARAGLECYVFMPADTPIVNQYEAALYGAHAFRVNGLISDCGRVVREGVKTMRWFDLSTLKEPYRIEGKKTMGLELAEQFDWELPDAIFYPTGGGTGLIGMWKAFNELRTLGWLDDDKLPRMYACQSVGCAPIVNAFQNDERFATTPNDPHTIASGLRVPTAVGDFMILDAVRESGGKAYAASEDQLVPLMRQACSAEGLAICPETAACISGLQQALAAGDVRAEETVVIFNTGAAQKYVEAMKTDLPQVDCTQPIDYETLATDAVPAS